MLKILPLQKDAPIYIQEEFKPDFKTDKSLISVDEITVYEKKSVKMTAE